MSFPTFNARKGLHSVLPGARYSGGFEDHTEAEYNALDWDDIRDKPEWAVVEQESLRLLRSKIADNLNERTHIAITYEFRWTTKYPDIPVEATLEWQFNLLNLYMNRALLSYPYSLKVSEDSQRSTLYYVLDAVEDWDSLYSFLFTHIETWLKTGRVEKDKLVSMTRTELEEYRDLR